jgi:hypothetical protein
MYPILYLIKRPHGLKKHEHMSQIVSESHQWNIVEHVRDMFTGQVISSSRPAATRDPERVNIDDTKDDVPSGSNERRLFLTIYIEQQDDVVDTDGSDDVGDDGGYDGSGHFGDGHEQARSESPTDRVKEYQAIC